MRGFDGEAVIAENSGRGQNIEIAVQIIVGSGRQVARAGSLVAVLRSESLDDLRAAAMAVHVAEAADVHEQIEPKSGPSVKSTKCLVVAAAVPHP